MAGGRSREHWRTGTRVGVDRPTKWPACLPLQFGNKISICFVQESNSKHCTKMNLILTTLNV